MSKNQKLTLVVSIIAIGFISIASASTINDEDWKEICLNNRGMYEQMVDAADAVYIMRYKSDSSIETYQEALGELIEIIPFGFGERAHLVGLHPDVKVAAWKTHKGDSKLLNLDQLILGTYPFQIVNPYNLVSPKDNFTYVAVSVHQAYGGIVGKCWHEFAKQDHITTAGYITYLLEALGNPSHIANQKAFEAIVEELDLDTQKKTRFLPEPVEVKMFWWLKVWNWITNLLS